MSIKIDDLNLSGVKGQISLGLRSETSSVKRIGIIDDRRIIKHSVPGGYGTVIEDRGKESARLLIEGQFVGEEAMNGITSLTGPHNCLTYSRLYDRGIFRKITAAICY